MSETSAPSTTPITPTLLRSWGLPMDAASKYDRGQVLVIGGARPTPGAVMLAGLAALRVGAGRLTLAVADSVATPVAVAVPEAGVLALAETSTGSVRGGAVSAIAEQVSAADVVLVGPGLDDADEAGALLENLLPHLGPEAVLAVDAYALGALPRVTDALGPVRGRLILTPNPAEAARLLDADPQDGLDDLVGGLAEIAARYGAVVSCQGLVVGPDVPAREITTGSGGLSTSGSGDVLAGAIAGFAARGLPCDQAAAWGTHVHAAAGDRLTASVGPYGFLAGELCSELPRVLRELAG